MAWNRQEANMSYKKIIPFVNAENEASHSVVELAKRYERDGADELYLFLFSDSEKEKEEFFRLLREIGKQIDLPFFVGLNVGRFEDAKKAFYTGADKIVLRREALPEQSILEEVTGRFGGGRVWMELEGEAFVAEEAFPLTNYLLKHVTINENLVRWLETMDAPVLIRDSLTRNDLEDIMNLPNTGGVVTNYYEGKDVRKAKTSLKGKGVSVSTLDSALDFKEFKTDAQGLVPVIVQDYRTDEVLQLAYMNEESFRLTLEGGRMTYYSRSRRELWRKGDTSGHFQFVKRLYADCDKDAILAKVKQIGAACHTGKRSCFYRELASLAFRQTNPRQVLERVYGVILDRKGNPKQGSYTNYLFDKGIDKILKKCGEEATEMVIAAKNPNAEELKYEIADFLYHMMVLMVECGLDLDDVMGELSNR